MDDRQFQQLLDFHHFSWEGYRKVRKGVKKRVRRHMQDLGCTRMDEYLSLLSNEPKHLTQCRILMTVPISRFMRDLSLWLALEQHVLPELIQLFPNVIKVWSAGCACGEEVYSFKIIWDQIKKQYRQMPEVDMLATEMNPENLKKAVIGEYPRSSLKEVPDKMYDEYFRQLKGGKRYQVRAGIKHGIKWEQGNFMEALPEQAFHIIFLRNNLLTYCRGALKDSALKQIVGCLKENGFLIIGDREIMEFQKAGLTPTDHPCIYRR